MADEPQTTPQTPPSETPAAQVMGNAPEARNPDGSLKESTPILSPKTEGTETKPTTEDKPDPKADDKKDDKAKPTADAPKTDEYKFTAPEGFTLNADLIEKVTPVFKELGLNNDQAQKLVDFYGEAAAKAETAPYDAYETMRKGWRDSIIKSDLGNGKDGLKPEVAARIGRAIDSLPAEVAKDFREAMTMTGAGDNPAFIRAIDGLAARLGEGSLVTGRGPSTHGQTNSSRPASAASAIYPNLPSNSR